LPEPSQSKLQQDEDRSRLLAAARDLVVALEVPEEKLMAVAKEVFSSSRFNLHSAVELPG